MQIEIRNKLNYFKSLTGSSNVFIANAICVSRSLISNFSNNKTDLSQQNLLKLDVFLNNTIQQLLVITG